MREALERMRDDVMTHLTDVDKGTMLDIFDGINGIIETAVDGFDQQEPNAVVEIAPLVVVEARLDAVLRNFFKKADRKARTTKRRDTKRDSKKRTVTRKGSRKLKRGTR